MKGIGDFIALLLASTIFVCSFLVQFFMYDISMAFFGKNLVAFMVIFLVVKVLLGYVEAMFENCRKIL